MHGTGVRVSACQRATEREAIAVESEVPLPSGAMEGLLLSLGVRMGMFQADVAYMHAYRSRDLCDGHNAASGITSQGSASILRSLAPHLLTWGSGQALLMHEPSAVLQKDCASDAAGASMKWGPGAQSSAPFVLSWRQAKAGYEMCPAPQAGSNVTSGASVELKTSAAAANDATAAARREPQPTPPRHLGMGIMVGGAQSSTLPPAGQTAGNDGVHTMASCEVPGHSGEIAGVSSGRDPRLVFPVHKGVRAREYLTHVFQNHRQISASSDISVCRRFGVPPPVCYTRCPGSLVTDCAVVPAANHISCGPENLPQPQKPQLQYQPGKRARDVNLESVPDLSGLGHHAGGDDTAHLGDERGRPRAHIAGPGLHPAHAGQLPNLSPATLPGIPIAAPYGGLYAAGTRPLWPVHGLQSCGASSSAVACDQMQKIESGSDAAPFGELLCSVHQMGRDLCRHSKSLSTATGDTAGDTWVRVLIKVVNKLKRLLGARSTISKYDAGRSLSADAPLCPEAPLGNHAQLRAVVQLLLLVAVELPPRDQPRTRLAPEALDAIDYLLCSSPFVDFDGCDPQARAILVNGVLNLARLAAERSDQEAGWQTVRDRALDTLVGWLVRQSDVIRQLGGPPFDGNVGGLYMASDGRTALSGEDRLTARCTVLGGHMELFRILTTSLSVFTVRLGRPLALRLLAPQVVDSLLQPLSPSIGSSTYASSLIQSMASTPKGPLSRKTYRANALILLHAAVLALLPNTCWPCKPNVVCPQEGDDSVLQSGLRTAVETVLLAESRLADTMLSLGQEAMASCDVGVPLLGTLYALLLSRDALAGWAAVESAIYLVSTGSSSPASNCPLRRAWEAPADRRYRSLSLYLHAQVVRALAWMGQPQLLEAGFRCDPPNSGPAPGPRSVAGEQLGLAGMWLRAALDCGSRPMLAALTAELLRCDYSRRLLGCRVPSDWRPHCRSAGDVGDAAGSETEELANAVALAISNDMDGRISAQLAAALVSGLLREQGLDYTLAALCDLDLTWRALRRELSCNNGAGMDAPPPSSTLMAHRAMAYVSLAALDSYAEGSLGAIGSTRAVTTPRRPQTDQQCPVRLLQCVAEVIVDDTAMLLRWEAAAVVTTTEGSKEHVGRWARGLCTGSSAGLLSDLIAVLARSADCRTGYAADPMHHLEERSVLRRCLALLCFLVSELPPAGEDHASTNAMLRDHAAAAVLDHLQPAPAGKEATPEGDGVSAIRDVTSLQQDPGLRSWNLCAAQSNLARMLHRCIAGNVRICVAEGFKVSEPQLPQERHALNALAWIGSLLRHPAMRQQMLLERLLPPLLNLVVESLVTSRNLLLARALLLYDMESPASEVSSGQGPQPHHQAPLALIQELMATASAVLAAAVGSGLMASKDEAYRTVPGSIRIDASPLLLMEPAPRDQLRSAAGFAAALWLRTCLECFALPLQAHHQKVLLSCARPPPEEHSGRVRLRLASFFGNPPALSETELPHSIRKSCAPYALELSGAPASMNRVDRPLKLSECAIGCMAHLVLPWDDSAYRWAEPVVEAIRKLTVQMKIGGLRYTEAQRVAVTKLLELQLSRHKRWRQKDQMHDPLLLQHSCPSQTAGQSLPQLGNSLSQQSSGRGRGSGSASASHAMRNCPLSAFEAQQPGQLLQQVDPGAAEKGARCINIPGNAGHGRQQCESPQGLPLKGSSQIAFPEQASTRFSASLAAIGQEYKRSYPRGPSKRDALGGPLEPNTRPEAHYVAALAIERSEDHRMRLSGCMLFNDLRTVLPRAARAPSHPDGLSRDITGRLPPMVGEVVEAKIRSLKNKQGVLMCTLRDASVNVANAIIAMVVGPRSILNLILSDLTGRRAVVGLYGAVHLDDTSITSAHAANAAAGDMPMWPLKVKLSLIANGPCSTACGLVIEPRTAYVTQLRMALRAQDQRAATSTTGVSASVKTLTGAENSISKQGTQWKGSQELTRGIKAALKDEGGSLGIPAQQAKLCSKTVNSGDAIVPVPHPAHGPSIRQREVGDDKQVVKIQVVQATAPWKPCEGVVSWAGEAAASTIAAGGISIRPLTEAVSGNVFPHQGTGGSINGIRDDDKVHECAERRSQGWSLGWKGILGLPPSSLADANAPISKQQELGQSSYVDRRGCYELHDVIAETQLGHSDCCEVTTLNEGLAK